MAAEITFLDFPLTLVAPQVLWGVAVLASRISRLYQGKGVGAWESMSINLLRKRKKPRSGYGA
jgi:hypothetical protein